MNTIQYKRKRANPLLFIVMFLALGSGSLFAQWTNITGGVRNNTNIEVGGNARIEGTLLLPKTEIIYYINTFKVPMPPNNSCSSIVVTTPSNNFVFPTTPCTDPPSTVPVYGTVVNASINNNMLNGLVIQHTNGKEITVTPNGSIRFWNGQTIGPSGTSTIIGLNSPWVLDGTNMRFSTGRVWLGNRRPTTGIHSNYRLAVDGKIVSNEIFTLPTADAAWADDVFNTDYHLKTLAETEKYIQKNKHLEGIPSEREVKQNGIDIGSMDAKLLRKIEEQYLHMIRMQKELDALKYEIKKLKK